MVMRVVLPIVVLSLVSIPAAASAAAVVIGAGNARSCYEAAAAVIDRARGGGYCDVALNEDNLSDSDRAATLVNRGIVRLRRHDIARAIADFDAATAIEPGLAEAYVNKGVALVNSGDDAGAIGLLTRGLELRTAKPEVAYFSRAVAYELRGEVRRAYDDYRMAAQLRPGWSEPRDELKRFSVTSGSAR
jgi:tetratricopeptide (TPR) repeat protein